jgi:hypothetical protein
MEKDFFCKYFNFKKTIRLEDGYFVQVHLEIAPSILNVLPEKDSDVVKSPTPSPKPAAAEDPCACETISSGTPAPTPVKKARGRPHGALGSKKKSILKMLEEKQNKRKRGRPQGSRNKQRYSLELIV